MEKQQNPDSRGEIFKDYSFKHQKNLLRSQSTSLRKQIRVNRRSSFHQERKEEPTSRCAEANEDPLSLNSLQECFNDVIELYSDSINRNIEVKVNDCKRIDTILIKLNQIEVRQKDAQEREIQNEKLGSFLLENISTKLSPLDVRKYQTFV